MSDSKPATIVEAEKQRCQALLDNDFATLDRLLDDRLFYVHASGVAEGKTAMLSHLKEGRVRYRGVTWDQQNLIDLTPESGILAGTITVEVTVMGKDHKFGLIMMGVWSRASGDWKLVGYQTTNVAAAA